MIKLAMVGLGKMGLSHLATARAHPGVDLVAGCDASSLLTSTLSKYIDLKCYTSYEQLLEQSELDAVIIATPSKYHAAMIRQALDRDIHVFCEKPFVLDPIEGAGLANLAEDRRLVNQVGYHYRFVGAFKKAAEIVASGALGKVHHIRAEAYGPVVLREKGRTWRAAKSEGGGALYDYACHAIDLVNFLYRPATSVSGVARNRIFSADVDDEVYCTMGFDDGCSGQLSVNWSDESHRKMSTQISIWGTNGRMVVDRQECRVSLRKSVPAMPDLNTGWTVFNTTELSDPVWYYLRGEEYSAQIDHFVNNVEDRRLDGENSFRSALGTDRIVADILAAESTSQAHAPVPLIKSATSGRSGFRSWLRERSR